MGKYNRNNMSTLPTTPFDLGVHQATITDVKDEVSKSGLDQFKITITGREDEKGQVTLTFGTKFVEEAINRMLASIEDAGYEIPETIDFGCNPETVSFIFDKSVFIWQRKNTYTNQAGNDVVGKKIEFITLEEFKALGGKLLQDEEPVLELDQPPLPEAPYQGKVIY